MAFESLTDKLQNVFKKLKGKGRLTEADVKVALKEVKMALLEADVNFKVVKQFTKSVQEKAIIHDSIIPVKGFCFTNLFFPEFHKKRPEKHFSAGFCRLFRPLLFYLLLINRRLVSALVFSL